MRVVHVISSVGPRDGGTSTASLQICRALGDKLDVVLMTTDGDGSGQVAEPPQAANFSLIMKRRLRPTRLQLSPGLVIAMLHVFRSADLVHIHGFYRPTVLAAGVIARLSRIPYVIQPHGVLESYQEFRSARRKRLFKTLGGLWVLKGAAAYVFTDESELRASGSWGQKGVVIPLGFTEPPEQSEATQSKDPEGVVFVGRVTRKKRLDLLLEAWPQILTDHPGATLNLVGPDEDKILEPLLAELTTAQRHSVRVSGLLTGDAKWSALSSAQCLVLPSEQENFALTILESIAAGTVPIVSKHVAVSSAIAATAPELVLASLDSDQVRYRVAWLLNLSRQAYEKLLRELQKNLLDMFSWSKTGSLTCLLYEGVLSGSLGVDACSAPEFATPVAPRDPELADGRIVTSEDQR